MGTRGVCVNGEWYHCFCRGVDKRVVFSDDDDFERFLTLLYVSNGTKPLRVSDRRAHSLDAFLNDTSLDRGEQLVDIGAYTLMPSHPHFALRQLQDNGIARFMQKIFTGYTMYFNLKHQRRGALFGSSYRSKHVGDDQYLKRLIPYVLLNPIELFEPQWKDGIGDLPEIRQKLLAYKYSSLPDFLEIDREEKKILGTTLSEYYDNKPTLDEMLVEALEYYREYRPEV
jgi:hypothetical protein